MSESYLPTDRLVTDLDRAIRNMPLNNGYRQEVLGLRNKLRTRTEELEGRLARGDVWFRDNADDPSLPRHENTWIELLGEYEAAHDAATHAQEALS